VIGGIDPGIDASHHPSIRSVIGNLSHARPTDIDDLISAVDDQNIIAEIASSIKRAIQQGAPIENKRGLVNAHAPALAPSEDKHAKGLASLRRADSRTFAAAHGTVR